MFCRGLTRIWVQPSFWIWSFSNRLDIFNSISWLRKHLTVTLNSVHALEKVIQFSRLESSIHCWGDHVYCSAELRQDHSIPTPLIFYKKLHFKALSGRTESLSSWGNAKNISLFQFTLLTSIRNFSLLALAAFSAAFFWRWGPLPKKM